MTSCGNLLEISDSDLRTLIDRADSAYYRIELQSIMTDQEYDDLKAELRSRHPNDHRLTRVGVPYSNSELRTKTKHNIPMGSLDNTDNGIVGLDQWYQIVSRTCPKPPALMASLKLDGSSICAVYVGGVLARVVTRGNGEIGEDVTLNGINFKYLPTVLAQPITADVRGEAILPVADFERLCELEHGKPFAEIPAKDRSNPRNVGNGIIGRDNGKDSDLLRFVAFDIQNISCDQEIKEPLFPLKAESDKFDFLQSLGFQPVPHRLCDDVVAVQHFYNSVANARLNSTTFPFELDGIVVSLNAFDDQNRFITKDVKSRLRPKYARAIKFPHKSNITKIVDVLLTVGHTRAIIPTALLQETRVGGVNVTHALLNNWDEINRLEIAIGDEVEVILAGDIIPKIIRCVKPGENRQPIKEPERCPKCGTVTTRTYRGKKGGCHLLF